MVFLYKYLNKNMESSLAMYIFLLIHITVWFCIGAVLGALLSLLFYRTAMLFTFTITSGAFFAIAFGYIYGNIVIIRNT